MSPHSRWVTLVMAAALSFLPSVSADMGALPDFSHAGFANRAPAPDTIVVNVRDEGARGDGHHDDSASFLKAIGTTGPRIVLIPAGRYRLEKVLRLTRSGVVLRGEGPNKSILWFPHPLSKVVGKDSKAPAGSWSWSGGFVSVEGGNRGRRVGGVSAPALRGSTRLSVSPAGAFRVGQALRLVLTDDAAGTLGRHLHADQQEAAASLRKRILVDFSFRVTAVEPQAIVIDRPLRTDVRLAWSPVLLTDEPTVEGVGIEKLTVEFPGDAYAGHHREPGFNAISFQTVSRCWVDDVTIVNADAGVLLRSGAKFCTVRGVALRSDATREAEGVIGHHGFLATDLSQDNLFSDFTISGRFVHDLCVSSLAAGNVFSRGAGTDLALDHHRKAPYENLFTELNAGQGSRLWLGGGDEDAGPPSGAREVFWNISAVQPLAPPAWAIDFTFVGFGAAVPAGQPTNLYNP